LERMAGLPDKVSWETAVEKNQVNITNVQSILCNIHERIR
jgi:hypothetical protein